MIKKYLYYLLFFLISLQFLIGFLSAAELPTEARLLWVSRWMYSSENDVRDIIQKATQTGFNGVLFQVRGNGTAYYKSSFEPVEERIGGDTASWDPLAVAIDEAHKQGIQLHAWVNTYPGWTGKTPPKSPHQLWNAHRDWFCVDKDGKPMELKGDYVVLNPGNPEVKDHLYNVLMEIVEKYDVDGLHLDYVRYFGPQFSYDSISLSRFKSQYGMTPEQSPAQWDNFRRQQVTDLVERVYKGIKSKKPAVALSAATWGDWDEGYNFYLQDAHNWLAQGIIDFICPMTYTHDPSVYEKNMQSHMTNTHGRYIFPGVGIFTMKNVETMKGIMSVSEEYPNPDGLQGYTFFDWTGLYKNNKEGKSVPTDMQKELSLKSFKKSAIFPIFPWKYSQEDIKPILIKGLKNVPRILQPNDHFLIYADIQLNSNKLAQWHKQPAVFLVYSEDIFIPSYQWNDRKGLKIHSKSKIKGMKSMRSIPDSSMWSTLDSLKGEKPGVPYYFKVVAVDSRGNIYDSELYKVQFYYPGKPYVSKGAFGPSYQVAQFVTMDKKGQLWFCDYKTNAIRVIDPEGNDTPYSGITSILDSTNKVIPIKAPSGMASDSQGNIYVSWGAGSEGYFAKLDPLTGKSIKAWPIKYLPGDLDVDKNGHIFVIERIHPRWHVYSQEGMEMTGSPYVMNTAGSTQINRGLAVSPDSKNVYVISESQENVQVYTGNVINESIHYRFDNILTSVSGAAGAVDVDAQGLIYISDLGNECIKVFSSDGKRLADLVGGTPPVSKPRGVAVTPDGKDIYIMEMGPGRMIHWTRK